MILLDSDEQDAMSVLLGNIVDTFEKLEIVAYLHRSGAARRDTRAIGLHLQLSPEVVASIVGELFDAEILCTTSDDDAGWWFDPESPWATTVEVLVDLYEANRADVLRLMKRIALQQLEHAVRSSILVFMRRHGTKALPS
jgi:hypothetical protein